MNRLGRRFIGFGLCLLLMVVIVPALADESTSPSQVIAFGDLTLLRLRVGAGADDVTQDGDRFSAAARAVWVGNGESVEDSYLGVRFTNVLIPPAAEIVSAYLVLYVQETSWIALEMDLAFEAAVSSQPFSAESLPIARQLTPTFVHHTSDVEWPAGNWYALENMAQSLQDVIDGAGWQAGNNLSVIVHGKGDQWGRKFAASYEGSPEQAPSLVVLYRLPAPSAQSETDSQS